jgi:hypothetical protein
VTSTRFRTRLASTLALALLSVASCDDNTPVCTPTDQEACLCRTGQWGNRTCDADGLDYGECLCETGDGGAGGASDETDDSTSVGGTTGETTATGGTLNSGGEPAVDLGTPTAGASGEG